jgi:Tfp pilus assembly protein PilO
MNTTIKRVSLIAAGAALVLLVAWYLALFSPQARDLSKAHKDHAAAEQKISQLQGQVVQLNALKSQIPSDKAALSVLNAAVPSSPQLDSVLRQVHAAAASSGVNLSSVAPSSPPVTESSSAQKSSSSSSSSSSTSSGTPSITLSMSATGSYAQMMSFLNNLATMQRTVVVTNLTLGGASGQLTAQISANVFYTGA